MSKRYLLIGFLSGIAGVAIGAVAGYKIAEKKSNEIIESEISSVRNKYNEMAKELADKNVREKEKIMAEAVKDNIEEDDQESLPGNDISEYTEIYGGDEDDERPGVKLTSVNVFGESKPYLISADEYGDDEHDPKSLNYYANGVLTEDIMVDGKYEECVVDNANTIVGLDNLKFADNSTVLYVRNDERYSDYEIIFIDSDFEEHN